MIGGSRMNKMLRDMIPEGMLLDATVSQQENKIQRTSYFSQIVYTNTLASVEAYIYFTVKQIIKFN